MSLNLGVARTVFLQKESRTIAKITAEKAYKLGKEYEKTYLGCSQCVVAALQDTLNIRNDDIFRATTGLTGGGGVATDGSCGAYVGAILILGFLLGRERDNFVDSDGIRHRTYKLVRKFRDKYIQEYGSVICRDIQTKVFGRSYYLVDPDEFKKFEDAGGHSDHGCPEVVGKAARWMTEIILEENLLHHPPHSSDKHD